MKFNNGEDYYNKIYLHFNFLIAISLLPFGYLLLQQQAGLMMVLVPDQWYIMVVVSLMLAAAGLIFQSHKVFISFLKTDMTADSLREKLVSYKTASQKKNLSFLLASLICVCGFYLTTSGIFVVGYIVSIILLSIKRPTLNTIIEDLKLSEDEQNILIEKKDIA
ncbi:hypothetical protein N7E81_04920 [Reichenbachiella carrageenanivorans]|uniref:Uncharacterized protein n=1 Tax=Reichenbachiella carrageenanivorans TaxID=2979869 RepID=A0ABY6D2R3_9BACT|nr:hypothetical protein [Reichenbachiella carrageenanivorans]UXX80441.1 hypothetical protein N7E81_04920 [Reichenbachiella carrageenanivorans]